MDDDYSDHDRQLIEELRDRIERDYVSVGELSIWLAGVVLLMVGLHLTLKYLGRGATGDEVSKPIAKAQTTIWVGRFADDGFAVVQTPTDSPSTAKFIDERLEQVYGQKVVTYWLSVFHFVGPKVKKAPDDVEWGPVTATATVGGKAQSSLGLPAELSHSKRLQLAPLSAPIVVRAGHETRIQLVFPAHDRAKLERVKLQWKGGGKLTLEPAARALKALQDFRRNPTREFFESVHADDGGKGSK